MSEPDVEGSDAEIVAIQQIISVLTPLDGDARARVVDYAFRRLGLSALLAGTPHVDQLSRPSVATEHLTRTLTPSKATDIRTFAAEKRPRNAIEQTAVVAYYLSELASGSDRKTEIGTSDVTKYFKQANLPLPRRPRQALFDARNAGYFDSGSGRGTYRLNPVGHNLVAHGLPGATEGADPTATLRPSRKRGSPGRKKALKRSKSTGRRSR
jgi:hypothetical protein